MLKIPHRRCWIKFWVCGPNISSSSNVFSLSPKSYQASSHKMNTTTNLSEQQFILRWHYQETTLLKNLQCFLDNEVLTDCTLSVESQNVKVHRLVLAMCSVYFFQLFQTMKKTQHPVIVLHDCNLNDVRAILSFMYRGQCIVSKQQLPSVLSVAKLLKIQGLCDMKIPDLNIFRDETSFLNDENENTVNAAYKLPEDEGDECEERSKEANVDYSTPKSSMLWEKTYSVFPTATDQDVSPSNIDNEQLNNKIYSNSTTPALTRSKSTGKAGDLSETCKCFLCGKYLSNQYNLRVHMETHEETYHACQSCPHVSRSRDALRKHVSYRHPQEYQTNTRKRKKITDDI